MVILATLTDVFYVHSLEEQDKSSPSPTEL